MCVCVRVCARARARVCHSVCVFCVFPHAHDDERLQEEEHRYDAIYNSEVNRSALSTTKDSDCT